MGFEAEFVRPASYAPLVAALAADPRVDVVVGSLHHVLGVPIDFDRGMYEAALAKAAAAAGAEGDAADDEDGSAEAHLWLAYYAAQHAMLVALRPKVVGHFDLIRLLSADPARDPRAWPRVWAAVQRNLALVRDAGGWLECNSSALRKGLAEPYPARAVAAEWLRLGGCFTLSDDAHAADQVGTHYAPALDYLEGLGVRELWTLEHVDDGGKAEEQGRKAELREVAMPLSEVRASLKAKGVE